MQLIGSIVFTIFFMAFTFFYAIFFVIACVFIPFPKRFTLARLWGRILLGALRWTCRLDYRVEGTENLIPGTYVALVKHSSSWETFAQAVLLPRQVWVLKRELTWIPVVGWGIRQLHAIAINRSAGGSAVRQMIEEGRKRLAEGDWIVVFPEGTRVAPGTTRRYGIGAAAIACETGTPIVPVGHDAGYYWPRRGLMKKRGTIRVVIGPPIPTAGRQPRDVNDEAQRFIEANSGPP